MSSTSLLVLAVGIVGFVAWLAYLGGRSRRAVAEFAARRGFTLRATDEGDRIRTELEASLGLPIQGRLKQIVDVNVAGQHGYVLTKHPSGRASSTSSRRSSHSGGPSHWVTVSLRRPLDLEGQLFLGPDAPIPALVETFLLELLRRLFGVDGLTRVKVAEADSRLEGRYSAFARDPKRAAALLADDAVTAALLSAPDRRRAPLLLISASAVGMDAQAPFTTAVELDAQVTFLFSLARALEGCSTGSAQGGAHPGDSCMLGAS